jgi:parallel beta-helix repeat protein
MGNSITGGEIAHNNQDEHWQHAGIYVQHCLGTGVENVYLHDNKLYGVSLQSADETLIDNNNIDSNCGGESGIYIYESEDIEIINNNITNGTGDGLQLYSSSFIYVNNNNISSNTGYGLELYQSSHCEFQENILADNDNVAIFLQYDSNYNEFVNQQLSSYPTTVSFIYGSMMNALSVNKPRIGTNSFVGTIKFDGMDSPPADPNNRSNIHQYLNITSNSGPSWVFLNFSYLDSDYAGNESTLKVWKYNGSWIEDSWNGSRVIDTTNNVVGVNITDLGGPSNGPQAMNGVDIENIFAPLGEYTACGNDVIDSGEQCDGTNLQGQTCYSLGYSFGQLACFGNCSYDTSGCTNEYDYNLHVEDGNITGVNNTEFGIEVLGQETKSVNLNVQTSSTNPGGSGWALSPLNKYIQFELSESVNVSWIIIRVYYTDAEVAAAGLDESTLRLEYYNETSATWTTYNPPQGGVNTAENYVWANTTHFSIFGIFGSAPVSLGGGGGAGGCAPFWVCDEWSECVDGSQTRTCTDIRCHRTDHHTKPEETRSCTVCNEQWSCGYWGDCTSAGYQYRECIDRNDCGSIKIRPPVVQDCAYREEPVVPEVIEVTPVLEAPAVVGEEQLRREAEAARQAELEASKLKTKKIIGLIVMLVLIAALVAVLLLIVRKHRHKRQHRF